MMQTSGFTNKQGTLHPASRLQTWQKKRYLRLRGLHAVRVVAGQRLQRLLHRQHLGRVHQPDDVRARLLLGPPRQQECRLHPAMSGPCQSQRRCCYGLYGRCCILHGDVTGATLQLADTRHRHDGQCTLVSFRFCSKKTNSSCLAVFAGRPYWRASHL